MSHTPAVDFIYFDAGGGHRSAAQALESVIASQGYDWNVRLVNLQEVLDPLDIFRKVTRIRLQDIYNLLLAKGWTLGSAQLLPAMQGVIRVYHSAAVNLLIEHWRTRRPDMVVSLVPNLNRAMFESLRKALPDRPFVTILTDLADYPPHFWIEKQEQYFICGTDCAREQAHSLGHASSRVFQAGGMILRPHFYQPREWDRANERRKLGLSPDLPTGLVLFGAAGSNTMLSIARRLGSSSMDLQLILICGRNAKLKRRLEQLKTRNKLVAVGFTKEVPYYMHISDFFVGKPGPGSISEALHMHLPVIVESNAWTLPQERYNAQWVRDQGVGVALKNFRSIEAAVQELLSPDKLRQMKEKISAMDNRAVFEIPTMLEKILRKHADTVGRSER